MVAAGRLRLQPIPRTANPAAREPVRGSPLAVQLARAQHKFGEHVADAPAEPGLLEAGAE